MQIGVSAAYFAVAGALSNGIVLLNMPYNKLQADEYILTVLKSFGCKIDVQSCGAQNKIFIGKIDKLLKNNIEHSLYNYPDIFPIAVVLAMNVNCSTKFIGISKLLQKESNRAKSILSEFTKLGANICIKGDEMYIEPERLNIEKDLFINSYNDHRMAMSIAIASLLIKKEIRINNIECVSKSFPKFFNMLING